MHRRAGEIADPSRMVEVEMGRHDVADIAGPEAQVHHLPQRRFDDIEPRPRHGVEQESETPWLVDVFNAEPRVDQDQPVIALNQEAVAAHGRPRQRPAGAAEEPPAART